MALSDRLPPARAPRASLIHRALDRLSDEDRATFEGWVDDVDVTFPRIAAALSAESGLDVSAGVVAEYARATGRGRR